MKFDLVDFIKHKFPVYISLTPCPAPRMTKSDQWKTNPFHPDPKKRQRKCVTKYFQFKNDIAYLIKGSEHLYKNGVLNIVFVLEMPKSWNKKKRELMNMTEHKSRPDRDNLLKAIQDSIAVEDGYFWDGRTTKLWGEKNMIIIY